MRIALVSTLTTRVTEDAPESIEGLMWILSREFTAMGHDVTVFALKGSTPHGNLFASLPGTYGENGSPDDWELCEWINLCQAVECSALFDVIHSHNYFWGMPLQPLSKAPLLHTLHVSPQDDHLRLLQLYREAAITAISRHQHDQFPRDRSIPIVPHGVNASQFTFRERAGDYVCFLGRFLPQKGPLEAIAAARAAGVRILLAGSENAYYRQHVKPLVDGDAVQYVGRVQGRQRDAFLGQAKALLYPIHEGEPFGLVMPEAMMCGTPVVAMNLGAVSEVIDEGITGYMARTGEEFKARVRDTLQLDRRRVRQHAEAKFSARKMAEGYEKVYRELIASRGGGSAEGGRR